MAMSVPVRTSARASLHLAKRGSLWATRMIFGLLALVVFLVVVTAVTTRYWLLPHINDFRNEVAEAISRAANQRVTIGELEGGWEGLRPRLAIRDLRIYDAAGTQRMALAAVDGVVSWTSLLGEVRFETISVRQLAIEVRRDKAGAFFIAGMPVKKDGGKGGFGDWLLEQHRLDLRDSALRWIDEGLGGVPLELREVQIQIEKRRRTWHFAMRSSPPRGVGAPIDLRGELVRGSFGDRAWSGKLYLRMDYVDLASLRQWIGVPAHIANGIGAIEVWSTLETSQVKDVMADVALTGVRLQLGARLAFLDLSRMSGRLAWSKDGKSIDVSARKLTFATPDGLHLPPGDFRFRRQGGEEEPDSRSELRFNALDLAALMRLADRLPLDERLRTRMREMNPRGTVHDFQFSWLGPLETRRSYQLRAAFDAIALSPSGYLPGFSAVSGTLQASEEGGGATLMAGSGELAMPRVFAGPLPLQSMDARLSWENRAEGQLLRIERAVFANAQLAGRVTGTYQTVPEQPGIMDLTGSLDRGDGNQAWRYVPLLVDAELRDWLRAAILEGRARGVQFKLRGDLRRFPFVDGRAGTFEVKTQFDQGVLAFAPGWPHIEGMAGELQFSGASMAITVPQSRVFGTTLKQVSVRIPDLKNHDPVLEIRGEAEGPTQDFLRYIAESRLNEFLHGFTTGVRGSGSGVLALAVDLPLKRMREVKVAGTYRFAGNALEPGHGAPRLNDLNGQLRFTEQDVRAQDITVNVLGMPARLSLGREGDRLVLRGRGRADTAAMRRVVDPQIGGHLSGSAEWSSTVAINDAGYELNVESDLRGVASSLPAPLGKEAAQPLPLRFQRRTLDVERELVTVSAGALLSAQVQQTRNERSPRILRGEVRLGEQAPTPQRDGLWLLVRNARLDADRWWSMLEGSGSSASSPWAGVELHVGELTAFGRVWHEVELSAKRERQWQARLVSREVNGVMQYEPTAAGSLMARFTRLHLPDAADESHSDSRGDETRSLPAVDVAADDFRVGGRNFGQLRLLASNEARDWRIRQLTLVAPQGNLNATGIWQLGSKAPVTRVDFTLDMSDIGGYFARLQLPPGAKGGSGRIAGNISWNGSPISIDVPTLAGAVELQAKKGRFVKIEPGIGKLIGVLSLQALPRRVSLDFRDVFSEGFAYDQIGGNVAISRGVAHTEDFRMLGPAARVEMTGDVNLAGETQRLDVKVLPSLSEGLALGAALLNPAVGIAALLAQKALKDPLSRLAAFEYEISGTWSDPIVMKKRRENLPPPSTRR
jgi:uncharacterized protein (TIGR02099 family)